MWQTKGLQEGIFVSVASKGLSSWFFGCVAKKGLTGVLRGAEVSQGALRRTARRGRISGLALNGLCPV